MQQAGGRISLSCNAISYSPRGKAVIDNAGVENDVMANSDRTVSVTTKNKAVTAEITLDRGSILQNTQRPTAADMTTLMTQFADWTMRELDNGITHLFTQAKLIGTPKTDTESGEISGLTIATDLAHYTMIKS